MNTDKVADPHLKRFPHVFPAHAHAHHPGHHSSYGLLYPSGLYQGGLLQPRYLELPPPPSPCLLYYIAMLISFQKLVFI